MLKQLFPSLKPSLQFILGLVFIFSLALTIISPQVQAQKISDLNILGVECVFSSQEGCDEGNSLVDQLISFAISISGVVATLVFIYGGYKYFFGGFTGDTAAGKQALISGAIGLVIVLSASFIRTLIAGSVTEDGFNADLIIELISEDIITAILLPLSSVLAVLVIIWGGYKYMLAGLPGEQKDGLDTIKSGVTGLVVVLLAYTITGFIQSTLGPGDGEFGVEIDGVLGVAITVINGFLIPLSSVIALFFFVLGGYYWMTSNGEEKQVEKAKEAIKNAVIGLVITLLAATIVQMIIYFVRANVDTAPSNQNTVQIQPQ
jgi:hypothetical protein